MNRESYEQLLADAKNEAAETIGNNTSPQRIEYALDVMAQRVATITRQYHLANLMGVDELAQHLGRAPKSVRDLVMRRHETDGVGRQVGKNTWIVDIDELPLLEQDRRQKS